MCRTSEFEMVESKPKNPRFSVSFVRCSTYGTVVGVLPVNPDQVLGAG